VERRGYRLDLAWRGERFLGWQVQPQGPTVQSVLEGALTRIFGGEPIRARASGRTDAGVHAAHQVVGIDALAPRAPEALLRGLNALLPDDIAVLRVTEAPVGFDPRHWAKRKHYRYRLLRRAARCPFRAGQTWHLHGPLDLDAMQQAAAFFAGRHDWSAFRAAGCSAAHALRTVESVAVQAVEDEVFIDVFGNGFLRHQVRIMAGTLVEVGQGSRPVASIPALLAQGDRTAAGRTAPAAGLWLMAVELGERPHGDGAVDDE